MASSTLTATEEPTRPIRPVSSGTPPQRSWILESGLALSITILGANLLAESIRDIVDPFAKQWGPGR